MKSNPTKTTTLLWLTLFVAFFGLAVYVFFWFRVSALEKDINDSYSALQVAEARGLAGAELQERLQKTEAQRSALDSYFLPADGTVDFIEFTESLGRLTGTRVEVNSVSVKNGAKDDFKDTLSVSVDVYGTWISVMRFISMIESAPYHIEIDSSDLDLNGPAAAQKEWHALLSLDVFKLK